MIAFLVHGLLFEISFIRSKAMFDRNFNFVIVGTKKINREDYKKLTLHTICKKSKNVE